MSWFEKNEYRFGNKFFAYFFLKIIESKIGCDIGTPKWLGSTLFNLTNSAPQLPVEKNIDFEKHINRNRGPDIEISFLLNNYLSDSTGIVELNGSFQYHTSTYKNHRALFYNTYIINKYIKDQLDQVLIKKGISTKQIVSIHLRRGDYLEFGNEHPLFWGCSFDSVFRAISDLSISSQINYNIYLCSDGLEHCKHEFKIRNIPFITNADFFENLDTDSQLMIDFIMMQQSNVLMISNSSLSFAAAMMNRNGCIFLRPSPSDDRYLPFDPWNSHVLLTKYPYKWD